MTKRLTEIVTVDRKRISDSSKRTDVRSPGVRLSVQMPAGIRIVEREYYVADKIHNFF